MYTSWKGSSEQKQFADRNICATSTTCIELHVNRSILLRLVVLFFFFFFFIVSIQLDLPSKPNSFSKTKSIAFLAWIFPDTCQCIKKIYIWVNKIFEPHSHKFYFHFVLRSLCWLSALAKGRFDTIKYTDCAWNWISKKILSPPRAQCVKSPMCRFRAHFYFTKNSIRIFTLK